MPKKCVLILLDGIGDRAYRRLAHQTPLQAARTPVLDKLAARGLNGLFHATLLGQALPSENAHFAMFGYDKADFPGRGALEALGAGFELGPRDVAVLAHFAIVRERNGTLVLENGKPGVFPGEAAGLFGSISDAEHNGIHVSLAQTRGLYGIITLRGAVSPFVTDTDPVTEGVPLVALKPWQAYAQDAAAQNTVKALKAFLVNSHHHLKQHPLNRLRAENGAPPINGLVTQRAGRLKKVTPFSKRFGLRGLSIASGIVYHGLSAYIGMACCKVDDSKAPDRDMAERLDLAHQALGSYDFIHVHTKMADEAAHTKDPLAKKRVIELLDSGIGRAIEPLLDDPDVFIAITADHSTPSTGPLVHSGETVPILFLGAGVRRDRVRHYDEISAAGGALGLVRGREFMDLVLNHLDRAKLHGLMDTPVDQPYWPGDYEPFRID